MSTLTVPNWFLWWILVILILNIGLLILQVIYRHTLLQVLQDRQFSNDEIRRILRYP